MLISHKHHFIYTKTVKTAGTSVESYFEPFCMNEGEWEFSHRRNEYISESGIIGIRTGSPLEIQASIWWNHMPAKTIQALVGEKVWNKYFKFCVVRNPFEKMVSSYHFFSRQSMNTGMTGSKSTYYLKVDFEKWLNSCPLPMDQNKYMINGIFCMDYVIKFESLPEGIEDVCNKLNVEFQPQRIDHLKKSNKPEICLKDYYSQKSIEIVAKAYKHEMKMFNYSIPW